MYVCYLYFDELGNTCFNISTRRYFLYYVYELNLMYNTNNTGPIDITVYHVKYIPYHSKNQINRGLHRWNQHHAGWDVPAAALFEATAPYIINNKKIKRNSYRPYYITIFDNYYSKAAKYEKDGIHWSFNPFADFDTFMMEHYKISKLERQKMFNESLSALGLKKKITSVN